MTEIEERAKKALEEYESKQKYHKTICEDDFFKDGYVQGATEQKAIDDVRIKELESFVERATSLIESEKAFREHLESENKSIIDKAWDYIYHLYANLAHMPHCRIEEKKNDFIKAMEG